MEQTLVAPAPPEQSRPEHHLGGCPSRRPTAGRERTNRGAGGRPCSLIDSVARGSRSILAIMEDGAEERERERTARCQFEDSSSSRLLWLWLTRINRNRNQSTGWLASEERKGKERPMMWHAWLLCLDRFSSPEKRCVRGRGISDVENNIKRLGPGPSVSFFTLTHIIPYLFHPGHDFLLPAVVPGK